MIVEKHQRPDQQILRCMTIPSQACGDCLLLNFEGTEIVC